MKSALTYTECFVNMCPTFRMLFRAFKKKKKRRKQHSSNKRFVIRLSWKIGFWNWYTNVVCYVLPKGLYKESKLILIVKMAAV